MAARSGKTVGSNNTGRISNVRPTPPPKPPVVAKKKAPAKPNAIEQWLAGDALYGQQTNLLGSALRQYNNRYNEDVKNYDTDWATQNRQMQTDKANSAQDLLNDFAARGALGSGAYNKGYT